MHECGSPRREGDGCRKVPVLFVGVEVQQKFATPNANCADLYRADETRRGRMRSGSRPLRSRHCAYNAPGGALVSGGLSGQGEASFVAPGCPRTPSPAEIFKLPNCGLDRPSEKRPKAHPVRMPRTSTIESPAAIRTGKPGQDLQSRE